MIDVHEKVKKLQVIFKIVERCNLVCSYCYYFFGGDETYLKRPPLVSDTTIVELGEYLEKAIKGHSIEHVQIVFHGGEPMMLPLNRFASCVRELKSKLANLTQLEFGIQTNGTLFTDEWIDLFETEGVGVGVSVDGMKSEHDTFRIDKHGNTSFDKIISNIKRIKNRYPHTLGKSLGIINVLNPKVNYDQFLEFFAQELEVNEISILLPDCDNDEESPDHISDKSEIGHALKTIFDFKCRNPDVQIRRIDELLENFQTYKVTEKKGEVKTKNVILVVHSDGQISIDDTLMPAQKWYAKQSKQHLAQHSFTDFLKHKGRQELLDAYALVPSECQSCIYRGICGGGEPENRYDSKSGFDNRSVYCSELIDLYKYAIDHLEQNGYPAELIKEKLSCK